MANYTVERTGQEIFFENYKITFENNYGEEILKDSNDGIFRGSLFEFKLVINDLNKVLFQAVKYLSKERIKGHNVPASIFLVDLNKEIVYEYKSKDYFNDIHKIYYGAASVENNGFIGKKPFKIYNLNDCEDDLLFRQALINNKDYLKINIDENCIVGWANRFYRQFPNKTKEDFLGENGELRNPKIFKDYINPFTDSSNRKFEYLMDILNDKLKKKELGAFYSPITYCKKSTELIREAISRVPVGNDYIILDRCAGTGNLERFLSNEELSHCILSTIEYYEYQVLNEIYGSKVKAILPVNKNGEPEEIKVTDEGYIEGLDALSEEFIKNEYINKFISDPKTTVIILENPPYQESCGTTGEVSISQSFIDIEMKKNLKGFGMYTREKANRFIWSAFKYYLRDENDSLILFSPIKYWKSANVINKEFIKGFIFNKKYFHATESALCCILWSNRDIKDRDYSLEGLEIFDIEEYGKNNEKLKKVDRTIDIKRMKKPMSDLIYEKNKTITYYNCICDSKGYPTNTKLSIVDNPAVIGFIATKSFESVFNNFWMGRSIYPGIHSGVYLKKNNYLEKLPVGAAKLFGGISTDWWSNIFYNTGDGGTKYKRDFSFLKSSLIYMMLCPNNRNISFNNNGKDYFNELCFDTLSTHKSQALYDLDFITGDNKTISDRLCDILVKIDENGNKVPAFKNYLPLNNDEKELFKCWNNVLNDAKQTKNYNKDYSYGLYQIIQELNTFTKTKDGNQYNYPSLNGNINTLKTKLKEYYKKYIEPKCFEYELLK